MLEQNLSKLEKDLLTGLQKPYQKNDINCKRSWVRDKDWVSDLYMDKADFKVVFTKGNLTVMVIASWILYFNQSRWRF